MWRDEVACGWRWENERWVGFAVVVRTEVQGDGGREGLETANKRRRPSHTFYDICSRTPNMINNWITCSQVRCGMRCTYIYIYGRKRIGHFLLSIFLMKKVYGRGHMFIHTYIYIYIYIIYICVWICNDADAPYPHTCTYEPYCQQELLSPKSQLQTANFWTAGNTEEYEGPRTILRGDGMAETSKDQSASNLRVILHLGGSSLMQTTPRVIGNVSATRQIHSWGITFPAILWIENRRHNSMNGRIYPTPLSQPPIPTILNLRCILPATLFGKVDSIWRSLW